MRLVLILWVRNARGTFPIMTFGHFGELGHVGKIGLGLWVHDSFSSLSSWARHERCASIDRIMPLALSAPRPESQKRYPRHEGAPQRHLSVLPSTEPTT